MAKRFWRLLLCATALIATSCPAGSSSAQSTGPIPDGRSIRLTKVTVEVPRHRVADSAFWDQSLGGLLLGNTRELLPDVKICLAAAGAALICLPTCKDTPDCSQAVNLAFSGPLRLVLWDEDAINDDELILDTTIADAASCNPCRLEATGGIAVVQLATTIAPPVEEAQSGCPTVFLERYQACQGAASARDPEICALAVAKRQEAAAIVRASADRGELSTMHPTSRLQLLEALAAAPATAESTDARNRIYATARHLNKDPDLWTEFARTMEQAAPLLHLPDPGAWLVMTRNNRRAAVVGVMTQLLSRLDTTVNAIRWQQRLDVPFQSAGDYNFGRNDIVLSEGLLMRRDQLLGGALEETVHAWQGKIARQYLAGAVEDDGPLCRQARFFLVNFLEYQGGRNVTGRLAYLGQPLEVFAKEATNILLQHGL